MCRRVIFVCYCAHAHFRALHLKKWCKFFHVLSKISRYVASNANTQMTTSNGIKRAQGTEFDGRTLNVDNDQSKFSTPHHSCIQQWLYYKQPNWTIEYKTLQRDSIDTWISCLMKLGKFIRSSEYSQFIWILLQEDKTSLFRRWIWPSDDVLNSLTRGGSSLRVTKLVRGSINTRVSCSMKRWSHMKTHNRKQYDHYVERDNITFIQQINQLNLSIV